MNGFTRKKVKSLTLGERMQNLRNEKRLSLLEVSKNTQIQINNLEALERGDYDNLPAPVYVKGFLRSYAEFFGVKDSYLLKAYEREIGIQESINKKLNKGKKGVKSPIKIASFIITPKILALVLSLMLAGGGFFYLYKELDKFISVPRLVILSPDDQFVTEESHVQLKGITDRGVDVYINEQLSLLNEKGEFNELISIQKGLNFIKIRAVNRFKKESVQILTISSSGGREELDPRLMGEKVEMGEDGISLDIWVENVSVSLLIEVDGNLEYEGVLSPKDVKTFEAKSEIRISSEKANATFVRINGDDRGNLSDKDEPVKNVSFTVSRE